MNTVLERVLEMMLKNSELIIDPSQVRESDWAGLYIENFCVVGYRISKYNELISHWCSDGPFFKPLCDMFDIDMNTMNLFLKKYLNEKFETKIDYIL